MRFAYLFAPIFVLGLGFSACGSDPTTEADVGPDVAMTDILSGDGSIEDDTAEPDTRPQEDVAPATLTVTDFTPAAVAPAPPGDPIVITFNQAVDPSTLNDETFMLTGSGGQVYGEHLVDGASYTFTPNVVLENETAYTVTLSAGVKAAGSATTLTEPLSWNYTTLAGIHVVSVEPLDGAEKVGTSSPVRIIFDQSVDGRSITADTFQVRTTGWVEGVYYEGAALPGDFRMIDPDGLTQNAGTMLQWYVKGQALPEYGVRHDVVVTRGIRGLDGATLDTDFESDFKTVELSTDFYYNLRLDGFDESYGLGVDGKVARMSTVTVADGFDWYVVVLSSGTSYGLWNRATGNALMEHGADSPATLETWGGVTNQVWRLTSYGGRPGPRKPYESYRLYYLESSASGDTKCLMEDYVNGKTAMYMRNKGGNIDSLWYFVRGERK